MSNTIELILEVNDDGTVKIKEFVKSVDDAGGKTEKAGKGGFELLRKSSQKLTEEMGLSGRAANKVGDVVSDMAQKHFPAWGMALGGVGAALAIGVTALSYFREQQQKSREELEKTISALQGEVDQLFKNEKQSEILVRSKYNMLQVDRELLQLKLADKYQDEYDRLVKLQEKMNAGTSDMDHFRLGLRNIWGALSGEGFMGAERLKLSLDTLSKAKSDEVRQLASSLENLYERMKALNTDVSFEKFSNFAPDSDIPLGPGREQLDAYLEDQEAHYYSIEEIARQSKIRMLQDDVNYSSATLEFSRARGDSMEQQYNYELAVFDAAAAAKYQTLLTWDEQQEFLAQNEIRRAALVTQQSNRLFEMRKQAGMSALNNIAMASKMMYEQGGKDARKYFEIYKLAAIAQTTVNTYNAAMGAYSSLASIPYVGPVLGALAAAAAIAFGLAQINSIRNQTFDGGGGGSAAAVGTFSADASTGLPTGNTTASQQGAQNQQSMPSQTINITINSPLANENWDRLAEEAIVPALQRASDRKVW